MEGLFCPNVHVLLVSVSQPAPVPAGHKMIATAMEIGLVRDVVETLFNEELGKLAIAA